MIISRTPFRLSFFGGGTDYPAWYRKNGGAVLATTIDKYCYLTCRRLPPFFEHKFRVVYSVIENVQTIEEITHPAVREVLRFLKIDRGVEIHHDGDLPARSGLGSSCAFTVGLLNALHALQGHMPTKEQLARESIHVEQDCLKEAVGSQDQVLAAYGGFNHLTFLKNDEFLVRPMTLGAERMRELNSHLMLFYTGIVRTASNIATELVNNIDARARELRIMKDMVDEAVSVLSTGRDVTRFGELLHEAWLLKRGLSASISNASVDEIYETARAAGAVGGKLIGAGGGGFMLIFVPPSRQKTVREKLKRLIFVPFEFESAGSQIIFFDPERDYLDAEKARAGQHVEPFRELAKLRFPGSREV